jgi:hypothetical protein
MDNPDVHIHHDDARHFLAHTQQKYDTVISTVSGPTYFSAAKAYTQESLALIKRVLRPGGLYHTWFGPVSMSVEGMHSLFNTIQAEFPHCALAILRKHYYTLSCSTDSIQIPDSSEIQVPATISMSLESIRSVSSAEYLHHIFLTQDLFRNYKRADVPFNTDDFPYLEFRATALRHWFKGDPKQMLDPIVSNPVFYNLRLPQSQGSSELAQKSIIYSQVHRPLFEKSYLPKLKERENAHREYLIRIIREAAKKDQLKSMERHFDGLP